MSSKIKLKTFDLTFIKNLNEIENLYEINIPNEACTFTDITDIEISFSDIILAFINVGYPRQFYGIFHPIKINRYFKIFYMLYLFMNQDGFLRLKNFIYDLDGSEKGFLAYELGMIFAQLISEKYLGINWTIHYSNINKVPNVEILRNERNKKQPDLIGLKKTNEYFVIEAKATTDNCKKKRIKDALEQLSAINTINGIEPRKYISYLIAEQGEDLIINLIDPKWGKGIDLKIKKESFIKESYKNFMLSLIELVKKEKMKKTKFLQIKEFKSKKGKNFDFVGVMFEDFSCINSFDLKYSSIFIGIEKNIFQILKEVFSEEKKDLTDKNIKEIENRIKEIENEREDLIRVNEKQNKSISIGNNGVIVELKYNKSEL